MQGKSEIAKTSVPEEEFLMTEGLTNALHLLLTPPIQTSIIKGSWVEVRPTNSLDDDSAIDFEISGSGTDFLDLANTL